MFACDLLPPKMAQKVSVEHRSALVATPCWCWLGRTNSNGYARGWWGGREPVLHRVTYELLIAPIPPGLVLDHLCRVRRCINPEHCEPVTTKVNVWRREAVLFKSRSAYT
jgi:hypothetical protein